MMTIWRRLRTSTVWVFSSRPIVYGYHGTSMESASAILQSGFEVSRNNYDWLGQGVYFFQDAPARAWEWAAERHSNPAVIGVLIEIKDFIDLLDIGWFEILQESYHRLVGEYIQLGMQVPEQSQASGGHRLDCAVINFAVIQIENEENTKIYGIRAAFPEGEPAFENSALSNRTHVQIAVRDTSVIKATWLEKRE